MSALLEAARLAAQAQAEADVAAKAEADRLAAEAAAAERDAWLSEQSSAALAELKCVLTPPGGVPLTLTEMGLSRVLSDMDEGVAVWSDGTVNLAAQRKAEGWQVLRVEKIDGGWTPTSKRLRSLADLGAT